MSLSKALLEEITSGLQEILQSGREGAEDMQKNIKSLFNVALNRANLVNQESFKRLENMVQKLALEVVELKNRLETLEKTPTSSSAPLQNKSLSQVSPRGKTKKVNTLKTTTNKNQ